MFRSNRCCDLEAASQPVILPSELNQMCLGYFDPVNTISENESTHLSGSPNQCFGYNKITRRKHLALVHHITCEALFNIKQNVLFL